MGYGPKFIPDISDPHWIPIGTPESETPETGRSSLSASENGTSYGRPFNENLSLNIPICFFLNFPKWLCVKSLVASTWFTIFQRISLVPVHQPIITLSITIHG